MNTIEMTIPHRTCRSILTLAGKQVIYYREGAKRHMWVGTVDTATMSGVTITYLNGTEQHYSIDYFRKHFCPAHWVKNAHIYTAAMNMKENRKQLSEAQQLSLPPADDVSHLGEFYVWRKNGGIPTKTHLTLTLATEEASRLAKQNPDDEFLVLSVAASVCYQARTQYDLKVSVR